MPELEKVQALYDRSLFLQAYNQSVEYEKPGSQPDNNVYALNAATGAKLWKLATGDSVFSAPAVSNGVLYIGSTDNSIYALDAMTGARLWSYTTGNSIVYSSPVVANGVVFLGSTDSHIYAFGL
jgi:serine/threonine-protein kinase